MNLLALTSNGKIAKRPRMTKTYQEQLSLWESQIAKSKDSTRKKFTTLSDIPVEALYQPKNPDETYLKESGFPGQHPYTRGVQPNMYRGRYWTMRQYAGFGTAEESNRRYRDLINSGGTGLSVAFDLPTQMGLDSDDPRSMGEVGKTGVAIDSLADMEVLFNEIDLAQVSTSMTINATASTLLAFYIAVGEKKGISSDKLSGTIQNDILKEYIARGTYIYPPEPSMRVITDIFSFCKDHVPKWNTISISGYHIREAGSTAVEEVAFTLANGLAYVQAAIDAGLKVDDFAPRLSFFFNAHNYFFEEVAKFRAARKLWAKLMKERFNATDRSCQLRFHTQTAGCSLTAQQIDNNIVRVAYQAMSAVLGGTQSLHTNSRDEALALPTKQSAMIALRTQQVLAYETGVADTIDPLAGSYFVEELTSRIERDALKLIQRVDELGGSPKAIEKGFPQLTIQNSAFEYQRKIEDKSLVIVGQNQFEMQEDTQPDLLKVKPELERKQVAELKALKEKRDNGRVQEALKKLKAGAQGRDNLMPLILDAVRCYTSLGEISGALREVFGTYKENIVL